jgi:phage baseplate assembly protein W
MIDAEYQRELLRRQLLGRGLACPEIMPGIDLGRDLQLASGPEGTDLAMIEGMDNLAQDLAVALTTIVGSDIFNTEFGFTGLSALAEESNPILARERIRIGVIQVLRRDPRIRRIVDVKLDDGQLELPRGGSRELSVIVTFETVSGDEASINLGRTIRNV